MKIRSKAPLRLGIAGGGTDVSGYSNHYGGLVLNATINLYAHTFLSDEINEEKIIFEALDLGITEEFTLDEFPDASSTLLLHHAVLKRVIDEYNSGQIFPIKISTYSDVPPGSGLGSSSTIVVSMIEALKQMLSLPLGEYDIAKLAYQIEREDCKLIGGKQDQYAATFGGFNFIEFKKDNTVIVNPLRIRRYIINELESSLILYFSGASRDSAKIIKDQMDSILDEQKLNAMHLVKSSALTIKKNLFKGNINDLASEFKLAWKAKKATSSSITSSKIEKIEKILNEDGVKSLKVSGAGGGGFMMIFVEPEKKFNIEKKLEQYGGYSQKFQFVDEGCNSWTI
jgi:D-glycero-alpha-D-manno-heptose-7-phosphate kinase